MSKFLLRANQNSLKYSSKVHNELDFEYIACIKLPNIFWSGRNKCKTFTFALKTFKHRFFAIKFIMFIKQMTTKAFVFAIDSYTVPCEFRTSIPNIKTFIILKILILFHWAFFIHYKITRLYGSVSSLHFGIKKLSNFWLKVVVHCASNRQQFGFVRLLDFAFSVS